MTLAKCKNYNLCLLPLEIKTLTAERDYLKEEVELWKKALKNEIINGDDCGCGISCNHQEVSCGSPKCLELHKQAVRVLIPITSKHKGVRP
jgi:hypothetical protein